MERRFSKSQALSKHLNALVPGGGHTYAKGEDQFPDGMAPIIERGEGCRVWDVDGNEFIEFGSGLRAVTLGHGYPSVVEAAHAAMKDGTNFTRPAKIEIDAAEAFLRCVKTAEMVKFAKHGSDATTAAVKIARAHTGREMVAICGDQPFFSVDDWFIGVTPMPGGIPENIRRQTVKFKYNDIASLETLFSQYPNQICCVMMEAETQEPPREGYLQQVRDVAHKNGALFVIDETITGFRWDIAGAQKVHNITPDLSCFGKGMANGFSVSALAGKREFMDLGGIYHDRERVFLLSTTHGAESHSLAAHIASVKVYEEQGVCAALTRTGDKLRDESNAIARELGIFDHWHVVGKGCGLIYVTKDEKKERSQPFRTLFLQETISRGLLAPNFFNGFSHTESVIDQTLSIVRESLVVYKRALEEGVDKCLRGRPVKPVFRARC
jgi:glutamate-1-semialdehyde 2,1-aminomutase